jgi:hypothetical protein
MELILKPNGQLASGEVRSYVVELPNRGSAVLDRVDGKGWELTIRLGAGVIRHRGLFSTPHDAVTLLDAEFNRRSQ